MPVTANAGAFGVPRSTPIFEYLGATSLTVVGSATGRVYSFDGPGARSEVDGRDQPSVARVPLLRRIA
jgi:hypothetical protein